MKRVTTSLYVILGLAGVFGTSAAYAVTLTWSGLGSNANWATTANWNSLPASGSLLVFGGTTQQTNNNNISALSSVGLVTFNNGGFNIGGNALTLGGGITNTAGNNTWAINSTLNATQTFTVTAGTLNLSGIVSGTGGLSVAGSGTLTLGAANSFTGGTTVGNGGTLILDTTNGSNVLASNTSLTIGSNATVILQGSNYNAIGTTSAGNNTLTIGQGSTLWCDMANGQNTASVYNLVLTGGTLATNGNTVTTNGSLTGYADMGIIGGSVVTSGNVQSTISASIGDWHTSPPSTITFNVGAGTAPINLLVSGAISQVTGYTTNIAKSTGTGAIVLSGTDTYTGTTTINAGMLQFAKEVSLYNDATSSWTAANIIVASAATAAFNVGGTGEFTASDIQTLSSLGGASNGFKSGSLIGLDTTNASGGTFAYGNVIANPNSGANTLGLTKLGTGTLTLTAASTYTGATTIMPAPCNSAMARPMARWRGTLPTTPHSALITAACRPTPAPSAEVAA